MSYPIHRRTLLRGLLGGAAISIGLPPLERSDDANGTAYAAAGEFWKRFRRLLLGNGAPPPARWNPTSVIHHALSPQLTPLSALKSDLTAISASPSVPPPLLAAPLRPDSVLFTGDAIVGGVVTCPEHRPVARGGDRRRDALPVAGDRGAVLWTTATPTADPTR